MPRFSDASLLALPVLPALLALPALPACVPHQDPARLRFLIENDALLFRDRSDGGATNAMRLEYQTPVWTGAAASRQAAAIPWLQNRDQVATTAFLGQQVFTAEDVADTSLRPKERPYAGWLFGGVSVSSVDLDVSGSGRDRLEHLELQVGIVGRPSGAESLQKYWHHWTNSRDPEGWGFQLHDEIGINLVYDGANRLLRLGSDWQFDGTINYGASVGNVATYAATGLMLRAGIDLPAAFGRPSSGRWLARVGDESPFYVFASAEGRFVWRNLFLDGNTFRNSHRVDKHPLIGELQVGVAGSLGNLMIELGFLWRSREYRFDLSHRTAMLSLSTAF